MTQMVVFSIAMLVFWEVYKWMIPKIVVPPNHPKLVYRVFLYKPSILGYPYFGVSPHLVRFAGSLPT